MKLRIIIGLISLVLLTAFAAVTNWQAVPEKAQITFKVDGPFGEVDGSLSGLKAEIIFDENNLRASSVSASVDVNTIQTGIKLRDNDLKSQEVWFNTEKYPSISFRSKHISKTGSRYEAAGELTLKGVIKPVIIPFRFDRKGNIGVMKGGFTIDREEFGLGNGKLVGTKISVLLNVPVKRITLTKP